MYFIYKELLSLVIPRFIVVCCHHTDKVLVSVADNKIEHGNISAINYFKLHLIKLSSNIMGVKFCHP